MTLEKNRNDAVDLWARHTACCFLRQQVDVLMKHLEGSRTGRDIEDVHKSRVACRRMCAGMKFYSDYFESGQLKKWQKEIRRLLKALGHARDLDVQIAFLDGLAAGLGPDEKKMKPGIKRMELRRQQRRQTIQPEVHEAIDHILASQVLVDIHLVTERTLFQVRHQNPPANPAALVYRAGDHVRKRIGQLLDLKDTLDDESHIAGHHRLRIAAKKLRYTLEICDSIFPGEFKSFIQSLKPLQDLLGDLHDCDVWIEMIDAFIRQEHRLTVEYFGHARPFGRLLCGLEYLTNHRKRERSELYHRCREYIQQLDADGFWDQLTGPFQEQEKAVAQMESELQPVETNNPERKDTHD